MNYLVGIVVIIPLAWAFKELGSYIRLRTGMSLGRFMAIAAGVITALGIWLILRTTTEIPREIIDAMGIGPAVGLSLGLRRPDDTEQK